MFQAIASLPTSEQTNRPTSKPTVHIEPASPTNSDKKDTSTPSDECDSVKNGHTNEDDIVLVGKLSVAIGNDNGGDESDYQQNSCSSQQKPVSGMVSMCVHTTTTSTDNNQLVSVTSQRTEPDSCNQLILVESQPVEPVSSNQLTHMTSQLGEEEPVTHKLIPMRSLSQEEPVSESTTSSQLLAANTRRLDIVKKRASIFEPDSFSNSNINSSSYRHNYNTPKKHSTTPNYNIKHSAVGVKLKRNSPPPKRKPHPYAVINHNNKLSFNTSSNNSSEVSDYSTNLSPIGFQRHHDKDLLNSATAAGLLTDDDIEHLPVDPVSMSPQASNTGDNQKNANRNYPFASAFQPNNNQQYSFANNQDNAFFNNNPAAAINNDMLNILDNNNEKAYDYQHHQVADNNLTALQTGDKLYHSQGVPQGALYGPGVVQRGAVAQQSYGDGEAQSYSFGMTDKYRGGMGEGEHIQRGVLQISGVRISITLNFFHFQKVIFYESKYHYGP